MGGARPSQPALDPTINVKPVNVAHQINVRIDMTHLRAHAFSPSAYKVKKVIVFTGGRCTPLSLKQKPLQGTNPYGRHHLKGRHHPPLKQTTTATDSVHYIGIIFLLLTCPSYCLLSLEEINKLYNVRSYHVRCSIDESMYYTLHTGLEVSQGSGQC